MFLLSIFSVIARTATALSQSVPSSGALQSNIIRNVQGRGFTALSAASARPFSLPDVLKHLRLPQQLAQPNSGTMLECVPVRTVTKYSLRKGKRKSVSVALARFYRLHWGGWIRTRCGRHKKMHKKRANRKRRLRQHVLVNSTQAWLLDKMATKFWKRPKHYIDDVYEPYHTRTYYYASRKPMPKPVHPLKSPQSFWTLSKGLY